MTPTARTLAYLRRQGFTAQIVERWNSFARVRQDLFGCIDIVALDGTKIIGVQCTSYSNHSARKKKIGESELIPLWKNSGGLIRLISWRKVKNRWVARSEDV